MGTGSFPYDSVRREVYRANSLDAAETAAALALENSLTTVDEQVSKTLNLSLSPLHRKYVAVLH